MKKRDPTEKYAIECAMIFAAKLDQMDSMAIYPIPDYNDPRLANIRKILKRAYFELLYVEHTIPLSKTQQQPEYFR